MANQKNHKEQLNVEDALTQSEAFIVKHQKLLIGAIIGIIVIVAAVLLYKNMYAEPREIKAQTALYPGQLYFEQDDFDVALNGDSLGFVGFLNVANSYSGTKAGKLAHAYAGLSYMHLGDYQNAVSHLDKFNGNDQMVGPAILGAIGNSYAEMGQFDKAVSYLIKGADKADSHSLSPILLLQAGQIYVHLEKYDDAIKAYTKIKDKYFNSIQASEIDKYIEQANLLKGTK